jgi:hypothetical protein
MLPQIQFFQPASIFVTGLGIKPEGAGWQYYLPFVRPDPRLHPKGVYHDPHAKFALPLSERRVLVATHNGDLALIDLVAGMVIIREKLNGTGPLIQISADRRQLYIQSGQNLYVLDAATLQILQHWFQIERVGEAWVRHDASESRDIQQQKIKDRTLDALHLSEPVTELGGGKLGARFKRGDQFYYGTHKVSGTMTFDIRTGAFERTPDPVFQDSPHRQPPSGGPKFAQMAPFSPPDGPEGFQTVVIRDTMTTLVVPDDSREAAIAVLEDLATRMERDLNALICCETISLHFVQNGKPLGATAFFNRFVDNNWTEAVPVLRRLMLAYLNNIAGDEGGMPWHTNGQAQSALRALMLLDVNSYDVYRLYIVKGDPEHDHGPYEFYAEFAGHHGIAGEEDIRFGIYLTLIACQITDTDPSALLQSAERLVTPERFADLVIEEAQRHRDGFWNDCGETYIDYLRNQRGTAFVRRVIEILAAKE